MKVIAYFIALTFAHAAIAQSTGGGYVGLTISTTDYALVTDITPDTPAADSPIHVGTGLFRSALSPFQTFTAPQISGKLRLGFPVRRLL